MSSAFSAPGLHAPSVAPPQYSGFAGWELQEGPSLSYSSRRSTPGTVARMTSSSP